MAYLRMSVADPQGFGAERERVGRARVEQDFFVSAP